MSERISEITLGCMPCTEKITLGGDYEALSLATEKYDEDYRVSVPWVISGDGGGSMNDTPASHCPTTGEPCPYKQDIDGMADGLLEGEVCELLDEPNARSLELLEYLIPERINWRRS